MELGEVGVKVEGHHGQQVVLLLALWVGGADAGDGRRREGQCCCAAGTMVGERSSGAWVSSSLNRGIVGWVRCTGGVLK